MLVLLYNSPEFQNIDLKDRQEAAWQARQDSMKDWRFWGAVFTLFGLVILCSTLDRHLSGSKDGTVGAVIGFGLGLCYYSHIFYVVGMPHYRRILSELQKNKINSSARVEG
jgi:hypothetical protein